MAYHSRASFAAAQIGAVEQAAVGAANIAVCQGGVDAAAGAGDDAAVAEVILQILVVGEQEAGAADARQGEDVFVIGAANVPGAQGFRFGVDLVVGKGQGGVACQRGTEPAFEVSVIIQFAQELAADDQLAAPVA